MPMSEYMTSSTALGGPVGASLVTAGGGELSFTVVGLVGREPLATWRVSPLGSSILCLSDMLPVRIRVSVLGRCACQGPAGEYVSVNEERMG
jgi:hypothetical protein